MKKVLFLTLTLALGFSLSAQRQGGQRPKDQRPDITQLVSNLTDSQKAKLETITAESRQRVDKLHARQQAVRDSIALYMDREGNQSKYLNPLFDREAKIQSEISREMYSTKVRIDEVLTKEQRAEFQKASKEQRKHHKKK
jgi:Spy/CpxP family protein refolding chaperone